MIDGTGLAALIAACCAGIVSLCTLYMQFINWKDSREIKLRTGRLEVDGKIREKKIDDLHLQVNGRLSELKIRIAKEAYEMGREWQRNHAEEPSPEFPRPMVEEIMKQMDDAHTKNIPMG